MCGSYWGCCRSLESACHLLFCCTPVYHTLAGGSRLHVFDNMHQRHAVWELVEKEFPSLAIVVDVRGRTMRTEQKRKPEMTESNERDPQPGEPDAMPPEIEQTLAELFCGFRREVWARSTYQ